MKKTRIMWALLMAGGALFAGCKSNNDGGSAAQRTETPAAVASSDNGDVSTTNPVSATNPNPTPAIDNTTAAAGATGTASSSNVCIMPATHTSHTSRRVAYTNWHRHYRKNVKRTTVETETSVAATEPLTTEQTVTVPPEAPVVNTTPTTPPATITYEKQKEYSGNLPAKKRSPVHLAPEAGVNLNNLYMLSDDFQTSNQLKVGFHGGVMVNVELGKRFDLQPGVRYIMKGGELTSTTTDGNVVTEYKDKLTFHYIEVPVNLVYNTGEWGTSHFMIGAGPYVSYLANAQDKSKIKTSGPDGVVVTEGQHSLPVGNANTTGNIRSIDAGAGAFIGYQIKNGVYIKGGAEFGLLDLQKNTNTLGNFYDRNYNFLLSVGYMCGYKK
jgi:hypothetical protein